MSHGKSFEMLAETFGLFFHTLSLFFLLGQRLLAGRSRERVEAGVSKHCAKESAVFGSDMGCAFVL
jgi:hypothetical protein